MSNAASDERNNLSLVEHRARSVAQLFVDRVAKSPDAEAFRCLLYTSPSPRDRTRSRMPSSA